MSWLFGTSIVAFVILIAVFLIENKYSSVRKQLQEWRENHFAYFISTHVLLFSIAFNLPWLAIADYWNIVGSMGHLLSITISIPVGIQLASTYMEESKIPTDPVEHELWWINGFMKISENPTEKLEKIIHEIIRTGKLTQEEVLEVLNRLIDREDPIGDTATRLKQEISSNMKHR